MEVKAAFSSWRQSRHWAWVKTGREYEMYAFR